MWSFQFSESHDGCNGTLVLYIMYLIVTYQRNVEKYYWVVGVMEMWEQTLQVLEHKLPGVFAGISKLYEEKYKNKVN